MKKSFILGFLTAALLFSAIPVGAAVKQYTLTPSTTKLVVDGVEEKNDKAPMLYMASGYNYIPAATFRKICDKTGVGFEYVGKTNTIEISTKAVTSSNVVVKEGDIVSEVPLNKYGLPDFSNYTGAKPAIEDDGKNQYFTYEGVKYIRLGWDKNHPPMISMPFSLNNLDKDDDGNTILSLHTVIETQEGKKGITLIDEIPYALHGNFRYYIPYSYYLNTFLPLIK